MEHRIHFSVEKAELSISVIGYEFPHLLTDYDANWLKCTARLNIKRCRHEVDFMCLTTNFVRFRRKLKSFEAGESHEADFRVIRQDFEFSIQDVDQNILELTGQSRFLRGKMPTLDSQLKFAFQFPKTSMAGILQSVEGIIEAYPKRGEMITVRSKGSE